MQDIKQLESVPFPSMEISENFSFDAICEAGTFSFKFKWFNDRWNLWATLPTGEIRQAGVYPGIKNWTGYSDYGLLLTFSNSTIDYNSLLLSEMYLITWQ